MNLGASGLRKLAPLVRTIGASSIGARLLVSLRDGEMLGVDLTPYHAKYFAHDLTRRAPAGMDRLSMSLFDASVDLNPHQIEA